MMPYSIFLMGLLSLINSLQCMEQLTKSANSPKVTAEDKKAARTAFLITLGELVLVGLPDAADVICKACLNDTEIPEMYRPALFSKDLIALGQETPDESMKKTVKQYKEDLTRQYQNFIKYYDQKMQDQKRVENSPLAIRKKGLDVKAELERLASNHSSEGAHAKEDFINACKKNINVPPRSLSILRAKKLLGEKETKPPANIIFAINDLYLKDYQKK